MQLNEVTGEFMLKFVFVETIIVELSLARLFVFFHKFGV